MASSVNADGLLVRYGASEAVVTKGGAKPLINGAHEVEFDLSYTDVASATTAIPGSDAFGVVIPKGARVEEVETVVTTAFTSSGTVGSGTFVLGLKKASDRSTELDHDGLLTSSATGTALGLATVGSKVTTKVSGTGAGALLGTSISENGVITVANSAHASHPFTAGAIKVRVRFFYP